MGFVVCLLVSCTQEKNDLEKYHLKGNVKSIMTKSFEAVEKFGEVAPGNCIYNELSELVSFNKDGFITDITYYDCDGDIRNKRVYEYDSDNLLSNVTFYKVDWRHPNGYLDSKEIHEYNEKRQRVQLIIYDSDGVEKLKFIYEWDGKNMVKTMIYQNELLSRVQVNEYNGNLKVKSVVTDSDGKEIERLEYENNRLSKRVQEDYTATYRYNDKGLCCATENGRLSGVYFTPSRGKSFTYEYEYDQKGNWIKRTEKDSQTKIATSITIREITYY